MEGVARVYAAPQLAAQLSQAGIASPVGVYVFGPGGRLMRASDPRSAAVYALRPRLLPPPVAVYHGWRGLPEGADATAAAAAWTAPGFDPLREVAVAGLETRAPDAVPEPASWNEGASPTPLSGPGSRFSLSLTNAAPGLLVIRDNKLRGLAPSLTARVNGTPAPVRRANGGFAVAVEVPAGPSEVVFEAALRRSAFATGLAGAAAFLFLFVLWCRGSAAPDCFEERLS